MFTFHITSERRTTVSLALVCALASCLGCPGGAATEITAPSVIAFDEIDHVYTTENVPPPGSFERDAGQVAPSALAAAAPNKSRGIFGALSAASTMLGGASSVVASSGELGRTIGIADNVMKLAPLTNALGMAGNRRFDALLQTYLLPRVSPSGAIMLSGFLSAQADYNAHFPSARSRSPQEPALHDRVERLGTHRRSEHESCYDHQTRCR
jgi:hypothetical protein